MCTAFVILLAPLNFKLFLAPSDPQMSLIPTLTISDGLYLKKKHQQQNSGLHFKTEVIFCIKCSLLKEAFLPVLWAQQFPIIFQQTLQGMQCSCSYLCSHKHKPLREVVGCACKTHADIRFRSSIRAKLAQQCLVS